MWQQIPEVSKGVEAWHDHRDQERLARTRQYLRQMRATLKSGGDSETIRLQCIRTAAALAIRNRRVSQHLDSREADPDEGVSPASESSARDYSSLPEEVRAIAVMLAGGHTIAEVARARRCSEKTIRRIVGRFARIPSHDVRG